MHFGSLQREVQTALLSLYTVADPRIAASLASEGIIGGIPRRALRRVKLLELEDHDYVRGDVELTRLYGYVPGRRVHPGRAVHRPGNQAHIA